MRKFLAVVKHEYKKIVLKWSFLLATLLFPVLAAAFAVVPALIFSIKGEPTRIAVVDQTGKITPRLKENLSAERITAKAKQAAKDSATDLNASQEERMKRNAEQFGESLFLPIIIRMKNNSNKFAANLTAKLPIRNSTHI